MSGKLCTGFKTNNSFRLRDSKAYCEGLEYRIGGTWAERPDTDNPHPIYSSAYWSWEIGWLHADGLAGSSMPASMAPCCAVPQNIIQT